MKTEIDIYMHKLVALETRETAYFSLCNKYFQARGLREMSELKFLGDLDGNWHRSGGGLINHEMKQIMPKM